MAEEEISPSEIAPKSPKPWLKILLFSVLGLVLVAGFVFAGFWFGKRQTLQTFQITPTPTPEVVATPTPDPTANWKTYRDENFNYYQVKYPANWELAPKTGGCGAFWGPEFAPKQTSYKYWIRICGPLISPDATPEFLAANRYIEDKQVTLLFQENIQIDNHKAIKQKFKRTQTDGTEIIETVIFVGDAKVTSVAGRDIPEQEVGAIEIHSYDRPGSGLEAEKVLNYMLSTFKFLPSAD